MGQAGYDNQGFAEPAQQQQEEGKHQEHLEPFIYSHDVVTNNLDSYCRKEMALGVPTD